MAAHRNRKDTYTLSGSPPTSTALATLATALRAGDATTFGIPCDGGRGVNCVASVAASKTLTSGTLRAFCYMPTDVTADGAVSARRWVRCPNLDITLVGGDLERDEPSGDMETPVGAYRFALVPDAVVGSTGSTSLQLTYGARKDGI